MKVQKIKLIQIIADSSLGGGPKHILGILKNIDKEKFEVALICPPGYLSVEAKLLKNISVYNWTPRSKFDWIALFELRNIIHKIRSEGEPFAPTIIHSHGPRAGLFVRAIAPVGVAQVYTEHSLDENYSLKSSLNYYIQRNILKRQNMKTDLVIAVSSSVEKYLLDQNFVSKEKLVRIPNGIDPLLEPYEGKIKEHNLMPTVGTVGNLNLQKGQGYLIDALEIVKENFPLIKLEIVGEGPERGSLEQKIKQKKLQKNVKLLGYQSKIAPIMKKWDVFVLSSVSETFGISILEAMQLGIPVVATEVGGIPDIVTHRKNGLLVLAEKPEDIARAILEVLSKPALAAKLKREGKERVQEFLWSKVVKKMEREYIKLVNL